MWQGFDWRSPEEVHYAEEEMLARINLVYEEMSKLHWENYKKVHESIDPVDVIESLFGTVTGPRDLEQSPLPDDPPPSFEFALH